MIFRKALEDVLTQDDLGWNEQVNECRQEIRKAEHVDVVKSINAVILIYSGEACQPDNLAMLCKFFCVHWP